MNSKLIPLFSNLDAEESSSVKAVLDGLDEGQQEQFATVYLNKRRDSSLILVCILAGFGVCWFTPFYHGPNWFWTTLFLHRRFSFDWNHH